MSRFQVESLSLVGLKLIKRLRVSDARGALSRLFCADELAVAGWTKPIAQINHTRTSRRGTVRGLHYQMETNAEMKLVSCIRGEIWDVAIDLRSSSPTFLQFHAQTLSEHNGCAMLVPEGFAHGFQTQTDECELIYLHTAAYSPQEEAGLRFNDPSLAIPWPIAITVISDRDQSHPLLTKQFQGINVL
jgi:dTDP-4-dehydrorhamnose 3,5-epimerase